MDVTSVRRVRQEDWTDEGVRFLRARDLVAFAKNEAIEDPLFISDEMYREYSALSGKVVVGDLLVTGVGTIGVPWLVTSENPVYFKDGNIIWFKNQNAIDGEFFYHSFTAHAIQSYIKEAAGIGTVGTYTIETGKKTPIWLPLEREQRQIAAFMTSLDTLITLHRRKCQYRGLYGYLSWEQRKWSEYVSISTDMVDPCSGNYDNLPHVGPGNMESFTGRLYDNVNTVKDDALISGKFHFDPGDIIYGKINPQLGKYTYAQFEGLASADAYVLNGKNGLTQEFLFGILQTKAFFDYSVSVSMRSGMPKINRDELNAFEFLAPNESEQRAIGDILLKLDDLITLHQRKLELLRNIKKSLLDRMFV